MSKVKVFETLGRPYGWVEEITILCEVARDRATGDETVRRIRLRADKIRAYARHHRCSFEQAKRRMVAAMGYQV